jgi:hypothetical protein
MDFLSCTTEFHSFYTLKINGKGFNARDAEDEGGAKKHKDQR